ncbi:MAG: Unknown protein [uncultured Sulfurovum sp.]|uniref:Uncharacterized protein n=1 Tax=uncultured Sulfurovum sp. TaxID=269237 RepID=A0A6S6SP80_9BACT|nr:MAG: Unknown protein [uncultured Sulfurovum sp.]
MNILKFIYLFIFLSSSAYSVCNIEATCTSPLLEDTTKHRIKPISLRLKEFNNALKTLATRLEYGNSLNEYEIFEFNKLYHRYTIRLMSNKKLVYDLINLKNVALMEAETEAIKSTVIIENINKDKNDD